MNDGSQLRAPFHVTPLVDRKDPDGEGLLLEDVRAPLHLDEQRS